MSATVYQLRVARSEEDEICYECGVEFASPVLAKRRNDGKQFFCPNGHRQAYTETSAIKLRKLLEAETLLRQSAEREAEWQRAQAKNARIQETKTKNKLKRVETRVNAGVCPHCNRTFKQLAAHMKCKHAKLTAADAAPDEVNG